MEFKFSFNFDKKDTSCEYIIPLICTDAEFCEFIDELTDNGKMDELETKYGIHDGEGDADYGGFSSYEVEEGKMFELVNIWYDLLNAKGLVDLSNTY